MLHYTYNRFDDLKSRRDRCDCAPTEEDAKRCFILPFDRMVSPGIVYEWQLARAQGDVPHACSLEWLRRRCQAAGLCELGQRPLLTARDCPSCAGLPGGVAENGCGAAEVVQGPADLE